MKPPDEGTMLRDFPWVVVRMRCHFCRRGGDVRLAVYAEKYGAYATVGHLVIEFIKGCEWAPWNPTRRPQKYGMKCGGYCPDLRRPDPPDLPPSMVGLNLIEGGKDDQLPAEHGRQPRRRRVGSAD
ncbi:hypothetical protein [Bosea sp. (in: a-proteobacteria)]|uniref:hypothetical protein n=1 Tax=Bosea sp. (in: a-proteobacteria) TaxID=1871050 RepID=UPI00260D3640|nr:hypothetical protein [Bosea sp. (in: a-proteobacteria)]MCO5092085.1 hypothetical protein [Bosea sp. (in: a-proteobacteria)]